MIPVCCIRGDFFFYYFAFYLIPKLGKENIHCPCQQVRAFGLPPSSISWAERGLWAPRRAALPPLPGAGGEGRAHLLPRAALHRPLILSPLMLILEVVHRSSLICYPGGVSFRASERETGDSIRVSRVVQEHHQLQKAAGCAQQMPVEAVSRRPGFYPQLSRYLLLLCPSPLPPARPTHPPQPPCYRPGPLSDPSPYSHTPPCSLLAHLHA